MAEKSEGQPPSNWADCLAIGSGVAYCVCGMIAFLLDVGYARHSGQFAIVSPYSLPVMKWAIAANFLASLVAYIGYPKRLLSRVVAVVLSLWCAAATVVLWYMWLHPPDWARWS